MGPIEDGVLTTLGAVDWAEVDAWELSYQVRHKHISKRCAPRTPHKNNCIRGAGVHCQPASIANRILG